jgi:hypothetical protein
MGKGADGSQQKKPELAQEDQWIATLDLKGFKQEVKDIGETLLKNQGQADVGEDRRHPRLVPRAFSC